MLKSSLKAIGRRWTVIAQAFGNFQARLILAVLYVVLLAPFALLTRLFYDPLQLRQPASPSWLSRPTRPPTVEEGRRQFS